eukprot:scaffold22545_cov126-Isochrysis_galbana.AAC.11
MARPAMAGERVGTSSAGTKATFANIMGPEGQAGPRIRPSAASLEGDVSRDRGDLRGALSQVVLSKIGT